MYLEVLSIVFTIIILSFLIFTSKKSKNKELIAKMTMVMFQREIEINLSQQQLREQILKAIMLSTKEQKDRLSRKEQEDRILKILKSMQSIDLKSTSEREENSKLKENLRQIRPRRMAYIKLKREKRQEKMKYNNMNLFSNATRNDTFSEELIDIKLKQLKLILLCSSFIQLFLLVINITTKILIDYKAFIIFLSLSWLILIYYLVLIFRFNNGYYGTNYSEARELIYYIKNQKDSSNNNTKGKKIFYHNTETEDSEKQPEVIGETECL